MGSSDEQPFILIAEDEPNIASFAKMYLEAAGFRVEVAERGDTALDAIEAERPDLLLLDLNLPGVDGFEVTRRIRQSGGAMPILMLTARDDAVDKVVGLELGADDYVTKPYSARELIARIRAVLRRGAEPDEGGVAEAVLESGPVRMDVERHVVSVDGRPIAMPLKEFDLLEYLMRNKGRVLTRGQLIDRVWGSDYVGDTKTLDVHVKRLRSKIEADPANPVRLLTVRGLGYKLEG